MGTKPLFVSRRTYENLDIHCGTWARIPDMTGDNAGFLADETACVSLSHPAHPLADESSNDCKESTTGVDLVDCAEFMCDDAITTPDIPTPALDEDTGGWRRAYALLHPEEICASGCEAA